MTEQTLWALDTSKLFKFIDNKRRQFDLTPITEEAIRARLTIRCQVVCPGSFDLGQPENLVNDEAMDKLEAIVNEQFDLDLLPGTLRRQCACRQEAEAQKDQTSRQEELHDQPPPPSATRKEGSWLKRLFGG